MRCEQKAVLNLLQHVVGQPDGVGEGSVASLQIHLTSLAIHFPLIGGGPIINIPCMQRMFQGQAGVVALQTASSSNVAATLPNLKPESHRNAG
jgi:hypothetical protein